MKTLTEFPSFALKSATEAWIALTIEGKSGEEATTALGETLKVEGEKLKHLISAIDFAKNKTQGLKRVLVVSIGENEKAPEGSEKREELYFVAEFFPAQQERPRPQFGRGDRDDRGGSGGRGDKRGGGRGGDRDRNDRGGRGGDRPQGDRPRFGGERAPRPEGVVIINAAAPSGDRPARPPRAPRAPRERKPRERKPREPMLAADHQEVKTGPFVFKLANGTALEVKAPRVQPTETHSTPEPRAPRPPRGERGKAENSGTPVEASAASSEAASAGSNEAVTTGSSDSSSSSAQTTA
jgi:hypothetical protein